MTLQLPGDSIEEALSNTVAKRALPLATLEPTLDHVYHPLACGR